MLIADDTAELWLGENESWQTKRLVAQANQPPGSARLGWTRTDEQGRVQPLRAEQIARVRLNGGSEYYLEVLHKQDGGQDHCAVAWVLPGAEKPELIGARHLVSWKPSPADTADDSLPDDWQRAAGLLDAKVDPAVRHAEADPDGDGATNRDEWKAGTNPLDRADFPDPGGMLLSEAWTGVPGRSLADLTGHPRFPARPDTTTRMDNADFAHEGKNYGVRLRGYLTAPADGAYRFSTSGNHACDLYLSPSGDKFAKRLVARVEAGTEWRSFQFGGHFRDGPLNLERGKRYYLEVLFKRGENDDTRGDHSSVAWRRPGEDRYAVIGSEFFSLYRPDPCDLDDDDLPDVWETANGLDPADPSGGSGSWGDPDGDGLENFREFQRGLDPSRADVHGTPGLALWEAWDNLAGLPAAHRDGPGLAAALLADLRFPFRPTRREWRDTLEANRLQGTNFGARLRAHLIAPATGDYVFSIAGRDVGTLFLSPDDSKFNRRRVATIRHGTAFRSWDLRAGQMTAPVRLEVGKAYYIEAIYGRGAFRYDDDFFSIGWKTPGSDKFSLIGQQHLLAFFRDPNDLDDDDLPDDWEKANGLDPADPRGANSPLGDLDGDDLTNMDEYRSGTRADRADTDGDGLNDGDELRVYHTNPLVNDTPPPVLEKTAPLAQWSGTPGSWMIGAEGNLVSMQRRGDVSWDVEIATPGIYLIEVVAGARGATAYTPPVAATVLIDGLETLRGEIHSGALPSRLAGLTRWLAAGVHRVTLDNRNVNSGVAVAIVAVNLYRHEGADLDKDGLPDWLENICGRSDQVADNQSESAVSPACIEGFGRFADEVSLAVGGVKVSAREGLRGRWFADIPLDAASPVELKAAFEGGAVVETTSVRWIPTNLLTCPEVLRVRAGDELLLTAIPENADPAAVNFEINGGADLIREGSADQPQQVRFGTAGRIVLAVSAGSPQGKPQTRTVTVEVCAADFGEEFSLATGYPRAWELPSVPRDLHLEADSWLTLAEAATTPPAPRTLTATVAEVGAARVLARLHRGGPIVAAASINGFHFATATETGNHSVIQVLADGTRVVEVRYVIDGRVPTDLSVWLHLYVTDALFASGDTWYQLTAADFDENGEARLLIYKAPGTGTPFVCHWIRPFDQEPHPGAEPPPSGH